MELLLEHQTQIQIRVTCDDQVSHTFDLNPLLLSNDEGPPDDVIAYGEALYQVLFPLETLARLALDNKPERILLVAVQSDLAAIAWEYLHGPDGFLVLEHHFVRGLPASQRLAPPVLDGSLHIIAVPSNPLSNEVESLDIDGEWLRLKEIMRAVPAGLVLERTRPASMEQVRRLIANQRNRVVHFMGHGEQRTTGAILCFEKDNGSLDDVTAKQFTFRVRGTVFLVTLNACVSAAPGITHFSNLAAALVQYKTPYALGMRFNIRDDDAHTFSNAFYSDLANGTPVEEALLQARWTLDSTQRPWVIGVPVLYTSLTAPATGFTAIAGTPTIQEHQPPLEVMALTRAEGVFQGRNEALQTLGERLTGSKCPRILTIHGGGGQGKTALAREAVERFAYAWADGIWATSLENLPSRAAFATDLAHFLGIATQEVLDPDEVERLVQAQLALRRTLIVLDNAETLIEAVEAHDERAIQIARFLQQLPGTSVSLLVTSRVQLGWSGEVAYELEGLSPEEGASLFRQSAPQRMGEITQALAEELSEKLDGHPLSLRLLGGAFNASAIALPTFVERCEQQLVQAKNKFVGQAHRHYKLYACIETSVRYLDKDLRSLLSGLWPFHAPFLPETAVAIFDAEAEDTEDAPSAVHDRLYTLWQRGLLTRQVIDARDGTLQFYYLLPTTRPYVEQMEQAYDRELLLTRFGTEYQQMAELLYDELDKDALASVIAQQSRDDFEQGTEYITGIEQGYYLLRWGWIVQRLGYPQYGLAAFERALEIAQGQDQSLESSILNNMAMVYQSIGQMEQALALFQQVLPIWQEVGNRAMEATTLNNIAAVYQATGQMEQALTLYQQALPIHREVGNRAMEATTLNNMAAVYIHIGQPEQALTTFRQCVTIAQQIEYRALEAAGLANIAGLVYQTYNKKDEAIPQMEQALSVLKKTGLSQDAAGQTVERLQNILQLMREGKTIS